MNIDDPQLFDFTHDLIMKVSLEGDLLAVNRPVCESLGAAQEQFIGSSLIDWVCLDSHEELEICLETARGDVSVQGSNLAFKMADGQPLWVEVNFHRPESDPTSIILFLRSLNEQEQVRQALRESEQRMRTVLASMPDVLLVLDDQYRYRQIFTASDELLLAPREVMIGKKLTDFVEGADAELGMKIIDDVIRTRRAQRTEYSLKVNGKHRWFSARVVPFGTERNACVLWVSRDITRLMEALKRLEEDQSLLRSLLELETKAREVVAYEIHDGFVQYAVGTQMWLQNAQENLDGADSDLVHAIEISIDSINHAVADARAMIRDLRPVVIDEEGVANGLRQLVDVMQKKSTIPIEYDCQWVPPRMLKLLEGQIFRIVQESLNNMIQHSQASEARVMLSGDAEQTMLQIEDDGVGFDPSSVEPGHYGLEGIQRRASVFGGTAEVCSTPGQGTRIRVEMPVVLREEDEGTS